MRVGHILRSEIYLLIIVLSGFALLSTIMSCRQPTTMAYSIDDEKIAEPRKKVNRAKREATRNGKEKKKKNECQSSLTFRVLISWNCEQFAAFALLFVAVQHGWKGQVNSIINPRLKLIFYRNRANAYSAYRIHSLPTIHLIICNLLSQSRPIVQLSRTRITST